jgi:hypothetical protein
LELRPPGTPRGRFAFGSCLERVQRRGCAATLFILLRKRGNPTYEKMKRARECRLAACVAATAACKSPVDSLYYQAGCLFSASERLFFRRCVA